MDPVILVDVLTMALCALVWMNLVVILHELARCLVAWTLLVRPRCVLLGSGRTWIRFHIGSVEVRWNPIPLLSTTALSFPMRSSLGIRYCLCALAGPLMDAVMLNALLPVAAKLNLPFSEVGYLGAVVISYTAALFMFVMNFLPFGSWDEPESGHHTPNSDGYLLWLWLNGSLSRMTDGGKQIYANWVQYYDPKYKAGQAPAIMQELPEYLNLHDEALDDIEAGDYTSLMKKVTTLEELTPSKGELVLMLDRLATLPLANDMPEYLPYALGIAEKAHLMMPDSLTLRATLGALQIESGNTEQGMALLQEPSKAKHDRAARSIAACYLAYSHQLLGDSKLAREWLATAFQTRDHDTVYVYNQIAARIQKLRGRPDGRA